MHLWTKITWYLAIITLIPLVSSSLIITEIMYNPSTLQGQDSELEWIEIYNNDTDIENFTLENENINYNLTNNSFLIIARDKNYFEFFYNNNFSIIDFPLSLKNTEDTILLNNNSFSYSSSLGADGNGYTLELTSQGYKESLIVNGTPGYLPEENIQEEINYFNLKITEFLPDPSGHDDAPMPNGEWVELYNPNSYDINLLGFYLKDNSNKKIITSSTTTLSTTIQSNNYLVVYMNGKFGFLNNDGLEIIELYDNKDNLIYQVSYSDSQEDVSWSLIDDYWQLSIPTPSSLNKDNSSLEESRLEIEEIYDLGSNQKAEPGNILRIKIFGFKGNTNKKVINLFLEKDEERISKISKFNIDNKFQEYTITIPLAIPANIEEGKYKIVVQGLDVEDSKLIEVNNEKTTKKEKITTTLKKENIQEETETIKNKILKPEIIYESSNSKAKNLEIYFLCALLILVIITLKND